MGATGMRSEPIKATRTFAHFMMSILPSALFFGRRQDIFSGLPIPTFMKQTISRTVIVRLTAILICATSAAAIDLHPIGEVQSGYLFGATADGKWIKADEAAKELQSEMTYHVYGLTQSIGEAKGASRSRQKRMRVQTC